MEETTNQVESTSGLFGGTGDVGNAFGGTPAELPQTTVPEQEGQDQVDEIVVGEKDEEPVTPDASRENEFKYDPTGNASLDYALDFIGQLGYGPTHPAVLAAQDGNFHLIAAELAREGVRGADAVIALAKEAYEVEKAKVEGQKQEIAKFAYEAAGGQQNWQAVQQWASANATPQEKQQINSLLASGGFAAQSAISFLVQQYSKVNTLERAPTRVAKANAGGARGQDTGGALSATEYGRLVQELIYSHGGRDVSHTREYQDLQARRLQGRRAGL
uniref:Capsid and scaffold protein n=1 Tax=feces metagenome TaxID=1861841 RepID=A0A7M2QLY2_9ZZZZ